MTGEQSELNEILDLSLIADVLQILNFWTSRASLSWFCQSDCEICWSSDVLHYSGPELFWSGESQAPNWCFESSVRSIAETE
jgi:hypothetical protein